MQHTFTEDAVSCKSAPEDWFRFRFDPSMLSILGWLSCLRIWLKLGIVFTPFNLLLSSPFLKDKILLISCTKGVKLIPVTNSTDEPYKSCRVHTNWKFIDQLIKNYTNRNCVSSCKDYFKKVHANIISNTSNSKSLNTEIHKKKYIYIFFCEEQCIYN